MLTHSQLGPRTAAPGPTPPGVASGAELLFQCPGEWKGVYAHGHTGHVPFKWEAPLRGVELLYQREELTQAHHPISGEQAPPLAGSKPKNLALWGWSGQHDMAPSTLSEGGQGC